jgi:hypothetical protein
MLAVLRNGEIVMNPQATRRNRGTLERMNAGGDGGGSAPIININTLDGATDRLLATQRWSATITQRHARAGSGVQRGRHCLSNSWDKSRGRRFWGSSNFTAIALFKVVWINERTGLGESENPRVLCVSGPVEAKVTLI